MCMHYDDLKKIPLVVCSPEYSSLSQLHSQSNLTGCLMLDISGMICIQRGFHRMALETPRHHSHATVSQYGRKTFRDFHQHLQPSKSHSLEDAGTTPILRPHPPLPQPPPSLSVYSCVCVCVYVCLIARISYSTANLFLLS